MLEIDQNDIEDKILNTVTYIDVQQQDIDNAFLKNSQKCPIAIAIERQYEVAVRVGYHYIYSEADIKRSISWIRPLTTFPYIPVVASMLKFICEFDEGDPVVPTEFNISRLT